MRTPICDFVKRYAAEEPLRLHMPGHKGVSFLGVESLDITEISGADSLYEAQGIIRESEKNAGVLFGCETLYSTEGSSLCIRAMLYLVAVYAGQQGKRPVIAAGRNAHKTLISAAALLDLEVRWLLGGGQVSYLSCDLDAASLDAFLSQTEELPAAVYITSPDYLGNMLDIEGIAAVCHRYGVLLLVDNAHGAYLRFLAESRHPIDLGADLCCDSAHKTLPVLTGGAYLHISSKAPMLFAEQAKAAMALFASTSPSYLILQSLDMANAYLTRYPALLAETAAAMARLKAALIKHGYALCGDEPLKLTVRTKPYGYTGQQLATLLEAKKLRCEFADPDHLVLMITPELRAADLKRLEKELLSIPPLPAIEEAPPRFSLPRRALSIREAALSVGEVIPVSESVGRVLATANVGCPPAVPVVVCGEYIDEAAQACFSYYGINSCTVVKENT